MTEKRGRVCYVKYFIPLADHKNAWKDGKRESMLYVKYFFCPAQ